MENEKNGIVPVTLVLSIVSSFLVGLAMGCLVDFIRKSIVEKNNECNCIDDYFDDYDDDDYDWEDETESYSF